MDDEEFDAEEFFATWEALDQIDKANNQLSGMLPRIRDAIRKTTLEARQQMVEIREAHQDAIEAFTRVQRWREQA